MKKKYYYYLRDLKLTAKETGEGTYLFRNGEWESSKMAVLYDRLLGFDPHEEPGWMMGHSDIMHSIVAITGYEAFLLTVCETLRGILDSPYYEMERKLAEYRESRMKKKGTECPF